MRHPGPMSRLRNPPILILLAIVFAALIYGGLRGLGYGRGDDDAPPVPAGDQEVAWIHAATSGPSWERFVAGVHRARRDWPDLQVDDSRAFLDQTTAIPEVVLGKSGSSGRLRIRWRSEEHTSELQSPYDLVCRLLLEK